MSATKNVSREVSTGRRTFLKSTAVVGGAMAVGFNVSGVLAATSESSSAAPVGFNPFVKIGPDGTVTAVIKHFEMGQGTSTGLTTLVAEELDVAWENIAVEFAPSHDNYKNLAFGGQGSGG